MRHFIILLSLLTLSLPTLAAGKPNVLLILADDLGFADVGFNGCKDIPTPNLDSLAKSGVRCTQGYVSHPFCSPTRAGIMTGRYQQRFGHENNPFYDPASTREGLPLDQILLPQVMKENGYATGIVGKWHLGAHPQFHPNRRGFDEFFGFIGGGHNYFPAVIPKGGGAGSEYNVPIEFNGKDTHETGYITTALGREAAAFIDRHADKTWFLYLAFNAPHTPLMAPEEYLKKFASITDPKRKLYAAMISAMDDAIGVTLAKLREKKLEENTLIFFMSDNGGPIGVNGSINAPYRGAKGQVYEGGIHVPFVVRWKDHLPAGVDYPNPVISLDVFATAVALAGGKLPADRTMDSIDLIPFLSGKNPAAPHEILHWRGGGGDRWAIRAGERKLLLQDGAVQMFDLGRDQGETADIRSGGAEAAIKLQVMHDVWNAQLAKPAFQGPAGNRQAKKKQAKKNK